MKYRGSAIVMVVAVALLAGCGVAFRNAADEFAATQPASAWGRPPPASHREIERAFARSVLKDPNSAIFHDVADPHRWTSPVSQTDTRVVPTWRSVLAVNAKNAFGGYVGPQEWQFFWYDGSLIHVATTSRVYVVNAMPLQPGPVR